MEDCGWIMPDYISAWLIIIPSIVALLGAIGLFWKQLFEAKKSNAEALELRYKTKAIQDSQTKILSEFQNNGGSTMKDSVDLIKKDNAKVVESIARIEELLNNTNKDIRGLKRDIGRLGDVDVLDRQEAEKEHSRFYELIETLQKQLIAHIDEVPIVIQKAQEDTLKRLEEKRNGNQTK